jgi:hypothetical protein
MRHMQTGAERVATVRVELEIGGAPPRGVAMCAGAQREQFWGWLELMQVLQSMISEELPANREASCG